MFDRIHYGWVIDFIDVHITRGGMEHHWPTFNIADVAICVGVALMAIDMMVGKRARPAQKPHVEPYITHEPTPPATEPPSTESEKPAPAEP